MHDGMMSSQEIRIEYMIKLKKNILKKSQYYLS
jgi:hypothetical protein